MVKVELEIIVNRPDWEVFTFLANPENDVLWRSHTTIVRRTNDGPLGPGSGYWYVTQVFPFRRTTGLWSVTSYSPDREVAFSGSFESGMQLRTGYVLSAAGEATRVRMTVEPDHLGMRRIMSGVAGMKLRKATMEDISRLKRLLEDHQRRDLRVWRAMQG